MTIDHTMNQEAIGFMDELIDGIGDQVHDYLQHSCWSTMEQDIIHKIIHTALHTAHFEIEEGKALEEVLRMELNVKEPFDFDGIDI